MYRPGDRGGGTVYRPGGRGEGRFTDLGDRGGGDGLQTWGQRGRDGLQTWGTEGEGTIGGRCGRCESVVDVREQLADVVTGAAVGQIVKLSQEIRLSALRPHMISKFIESF